MNALDFFGQTVWNPLARLGLNYEFLQVNAVTIINTWIALAIILILSFLGRFALRYKNSISYYLAISLAQSFMNLITQAFGQFIYSYHLLAFSLFAFILICNWVILIPFTTEPTRDLNTTLALGLISFFYKEFETIRVHGFGGYIHEFLEPFFVMFPVNIIGHFSKIISISFRLFGNIFGGSIIMELYQHALSYSPFFQLLGLISGLNFVIILFFGLFEGLIQAFIFSMLTITYLELAVHKEPATGD